MFHQSLLNNDCHFLPISLPFFFSCSSFFICTGLSSFLFLQMKNPPKSCFISLFHSLIHNSVGLFYFLDEYKENNHEVHMNSYSYWTRWAIHTIIKYHWIKNKRELKSEGSNLCRSKLKLNFCSEKLKLNSFIFL